MAAFCVAIGLYAGSSPDNPIRQKARYYYMEGARQAALDNESEAYEYFKKAYETDPEFVDAGFNYGAQRLMIPSDTMQSRAELLRSLDMVREYVDENPGDLFASRIYGYVATRLDTLDEAIRVYEKISTLKPTETYVLISLSDVYMMANKFDKALNTLQRYEAIEGKSEDISMKKLTSMMMMQDTVAALAEIYDLIDSYPKRPNPYILAGNFFKLINQTDSTLAYFKKAEEISPSDGSVKISLAAYYADEGDSIAYDNKMYEALLSEDFGLDDKLAILGNYLQNLIEDNGDIERGNYLFSNLMEQYPHEPEVLDLSARFSAATGDFAKALEQIGYAADLDPANAGYWTQMMRYALADEKPRKAIDIFKRAETHVEPSDQMLFLEASAFSELKEYAKAEECFAEMIHKVNPDLPLSQPITDNGMRRNLDYETLMKLSSYYNILGDTYFLNKETDKAFTAYDNSLFFYPSNAMTLNNYAYFLTQTGGDLVKAYEMSTKAMDESEGNPTYIDTFAWVLFKMREYEKALEWQLKAIETAEQIGDSNAEYYNHLGDIYYMNYELDKALENWQKALELEPDNKLIKKKVTDKKYYEE